LPEGSGIRREEERRRKAGWIFIRGEKITRERIDGLGAHLLAAGNAPHLTWLHVTFVTVRFR
jgi:hypothetical protein